MTNNPNTANLSSKFITKLTWAFVLVAGFGIVSNAVLQDPNVPSRLLLTSTEDGFNGTFNLDGKIYGIENRVSKDFFRSRLTRPDGSLLVESLNEGGVVSVTLPTGTVKVNSVKPVPFSEEEIKAIRDFGKSDDCAVVKLILADVFKKRMTEKPPLLNGFGVISMMFGDEK